MKAASHTQGKYELSSTHQIQYDTNTRHLQTKGYDRSGEKNASTYDVLTFQGVRRLFGNGTHCCGKIAPVAIKEMSVKILRSSSPVPA